MATAEATVEVGPVVPGAEAQRRTEIRRSAADVWRHLADWRAPLGAWMAVAAFNLLTAASKHVRTSAGAASQWWMARDAAIPEASARTLFFDAPFEFADGRWNVSDRGPLQPLLLLWAGHWSTTPVVAYATGVVANSAWVVGLWWLLRALDVEEARIKWAVALTALTGVIWVNAVYPWPKLLAGAMMLGCAAAILMKRWPVAGVLAGLGMLAHGTALFSVIALVPWAISRLGAKRSLAVLAVAGAVYAPWLAYGKIADPPADRLMKFHFAGTDIFWPDDRPALEAIMDEYDSRPFHQIVGYKLDNARYALGDPTQWPHNTDRWMPLWRDDVGGRLRIMQLSQLIWAPGILLFGLWGWRRVPRTLWAMLAASFAAFCVVEWGGNAAASAMTHVAPMMLVVGWVAACALAARRWMLVGQVGFFVGLWLLAPQAGYNQWLQWGVAG